MYRSLARLALFSLFFFSDAPSFAQSIDSVRIGNGGGFSGQVTVYKIVGKKIWKAQGLRTPYSQHAKLNCKTRKQIKKDGRELLAQTPFDYPSNTYKWVELFSEGKSHRFVWGDPQFSPPHSVLSYYQYINQHITTLTFK